jgi:hypothetical protein
MSILGDVVIVVPVYRKELSDFEAISLKQAAKVLGRYPFVLATSANVDTQIHENILAEYQASVDKCIFKKKFFSSIQGYNKLLMSKVFYQSFKSYKYMLILQLDAFVFRDDLKKWCDKNYDYIGAPWIEGFHTPGKDADYVGVGNGGFSLRKVGSCLRVLGSFSYLERPGDLFIDFCQNLRQIPVRSLGRLVKKLTVANNTFSFFNDFRYNEDDFWGRLMTRNFEWFVVPESKEAVDFSMEVCPRRMFGDNRERLPFGCHAWWRYDLDFWRPYIESEGHTVEDPKAGLHVNRG